MNENSTVESIGQLTRLVEGSLATLSTFRHHSHPHQDPDDEVFDRPTIIFTLGGRWDFQSLQTRATIHPGIVVLGRTGQHYRCHHDEEVPTDRHLCLSINELTLRGLVTRYPGRAKFEGFESVAFPTPVLPRLPAALRCHERTLLVEAENQAPGRELKVDLIAMDLLLEIFRTLGVPPLDSNLQDRRLRSGMAAAREYMVAHITEKIDLATLARVAGFSPFHFGRVFKLHIGQSPHQYLFHLRIEQAMRLLVGSALPITQVCYEAGFHSLSHFITTFRKHVGVSPSRYRAAHR